MKSLICVFLFTICSFSIFSQKEIDTCIGGFCGIYKLSKIKNKTFYVFDSETTNNIDSARIKHLKIQGELNNSKKNGIQTVRFLDVKLEDVSLVEVQKMQFEVDYSGIETVVSATMVNNKLDGKLEVQSQQIQNGKPKSSASFASLDFKNGNITGTINFRNEKGETALIRLNSLGFLDGITELNFQLDSLMWNKEERFYVNGVLCSIKETWNRTPPVLIEIFDVEHLLKNQRGLEEIAYNIEFDNLFSRPSNEIESQIDGNIFINNIFMKMDEVMPFIDNQMTTQKFPLTKRFYYPLYDFELKEVELLQASFTKIDSTLSNELTKPLFLLQIESNSELKEKFSMLQYYKELNLKMLENISKVLVKKRLNFIPENSNLGTSDFLRGIILDSSLLVLIQHYPNTHLFTKEWEDEIFSKIKDLNKGLDSNLQALRKEEMNAKIAKFMVSNDLFYSSPNANKLSTSFYQKLKSKKIQLLKDQYLQISQIEKNGEYGTDLLCYLETANNHFSTLENCSLWLTKSDSLFTIFEEQPFDNRPFERKIISNIRDKSKILLEELIELTFQLPKCNLLEQRLNAIDEVIKKMNELIENNQNEEVQQLNRLLRRENNPVRIARILNLDFPN